MGMKLWAVMGGILLVSSGCDPEETGDGQGASGGGGNGEGGSVPVECPTPTAGPTIHDQDVNAPETWTADASPHIIPGDKGIYSALTIDPCATVQIAPKATITVRNGGSMVANGEANKPVMIGQRDQGQH